MKIFSVYRSLENTETDEIWIKLSTKESEELEEVLWFSKQNPWISEKINEEIVKLATELDSKFRKAYDNRKIRWSID